MPITQLVYAPQNSGLGTAANVAAPIINTATTQLNHVYSGLWGKFGHNPITSQLANAINPYPPPWFQNIPAWIAAPAWASGTVYAQGAKVQLPTGQLIVCRTGGTSGGSAPAISFTTYFTDNTCVWCYAGQSIVTNDPGAPTVTATSSIGSLTEFQLYSSATNQAKVRVVASNAVVNAGNVWYNDASSFFLFPGYVNGQGSSANQGTLFSASGTSINTSDWEFYTDAPKFGFSYWNVSNGLRVDTLIDGRPVEEFATACVAGNPAYIIFDFSATSGRKKRHVRFCMDNIGFRGVIMGSQDTFWPSEQRGPTLLYLGDSMAGSIGSIGSGSLGYGTRDFQAVQTGRALGFAYTYTVIQAGAGWVTVGTSGNYTMANVLANNNFGNICNPDCVIMANGINDNGSSSAVIQAAVAAAIPVLRAQCPNAFIIVLGCMTGSTGPSAGILTVEAGIKAGVAQAADPYSIFIPVSNDSVGAWMSGTGKIGTTTGTGNSDFYTNTDGTHASQMGQYYLAQIAASKIWSALQASGIFMAG